MMLLEMQVSKMIPKKVIGFLRKSAEGAMTNVLQNSCDNDEEFIETVESLKAAAQRIFSPYM